MKSNWRTENAVHLAELLTKRRENGAEPPAELVVQLQALARRAHRNAERMCNGELTECQKCHGNGWDCKACSETGYPTLAREAKAVERMRAALAPYRLRIYEQGDPRGWPLYLIPEEFGPASEDASNYNSRGVAVCPH
jgi:hypothetical protein